MFNDNPLFQVRVAKTCGLHVCVHFWALQHCTLQTGSANPDLCLCQGLIIAHAASQLNAATAAALASVLILHWDHTKNIADPSCKCSWPQRARPSILKYKGLGLPGRYQVVREGVPCRWEGNEGKVDTFNKWWSRRSMWHYDAWKVGMMYSWVVLSCLSTQKEAKQNKYMLTRTGLPTYPSSSMLTLCRIM